jgi:hypothetical protein
MYQIASAMLKYSTPSKCVLNFISTAMPIVLTILGYASEVDDIGEGDNAELNIARHAFSCKMR